MKIDRQDIYSTALRFLELLRNEKSGAQIEIESLELALDQLALAHHFIGDAINDDNEYPDPPAKDDSQWRELIGKRFQNLGYYNIPIAISTNIGESEMGTGDAIDDLVDIASELSEFVWRWENTSENNALWYLQFTYKTHWGNHLRDLQMYLQAIQSEQ